VEANSDLDFPSIVAQCRPSTAAAAIIPASEVRLPVAPLRAQPRYAAYTPR
jgi:hypothetical protein